MKRNNAKWWQRVIQTYKSKKNRQYNAKRERTDNTMPKEKGQTIQCQKRKDRQYNAKRERTKTQQWSTKHYTETKIEQPESH